MKFAKISVAITACMGATIAHSAGLERSSQSVDALFERGNYAEVSYGHAMPEIESTDERGNKVDNMLDAYGIAGATVKIAPSANSAVMLSYNQPWGVDTTYPKGNMFNHEASNFGTTEAHVETDALGLTVAGKPAGSNVTLYGGVEYQTVSGYVNAATPLGTDTATQSVLSQAGVTFEDYNQLLQGQEAGVLSEQQQTQLQELQQALATNVPALAKSATLYELEFEDDSTVVPMVGVAFEKPEIAMRTAITYRAPAKYNIAGNEKLAVAAAPDDPTKNISNFPGKTKVNFPQSVSLDFQTGLSRKHQLLGKVNARWVDWSEFDVAPPLNDKIQGKPLASYSEDQFSVEVAVAKQLTDKLAGEIRGTYDSGTGADLSLLGPYNSVTGVALGAKYDITDQLAVSGGAQYLMIEGGEVKSGDDTILKVEDSNGYALGMKVGYNF